MLALVFSLYAASGVEATDNDILTSSLEYSFDKYLYWSWLSSSYYGGIVLSDSYVSPPLVLEIEPPDWLDILYLKPLFRWNKDAYESVMGSLPRRISLRNSLLNSRSLMYIIEGIVNEESKLLRKGLERWGLEVVLGRNIPYYRDIKRVVSKYGVLGIVPSNIGPGLVVFSDDRRVDTNELYNSIGSALKEIGYPYILIPTTISTGIGAEGVKTS